jgi:tRNA A37 threonylcarbamoyladenosine modification protein TsaB
MRVLALDTSRRHRLAWAVLEDGGPVALGVDESDLDAVLGPLLRREGREVGSIVVVVGPGSHTGIRAGMAAAVGLAVARGLELRGIGSLDVAAEAAPPEPGRFRAVTDAGRGWAYVADVGRSSRGQIEISPSVRRVAVADLAVAGGPPLVAAGWMPAGLDPAAGIVADWVGCLARAATRALADRPPLDPRRLGGVVLRGPEAA